jgi:membrane protease YdiL (CAAX protease family)
MFLLPALFLAFLWSDKLVAYLTLNSKIRWVDIILVSLLMLVLIPFVNLLASLNNQIVMPEALKSLELWMRNMEKSVTISTQSLLNITGIDQLALNILLIAVLPALCEELFFRGIVQKVLSERKHFYLAIWLTAILFSAIHMQFYGFFPRMLLGALFGYLLLWSGSIWLPIFAHFINNAVVVVFYYLRFNNFVLVDLDSIGSGDSWWLGMISGITTAGVVYVLFKRHKRGVL